MTRKTPRHPNHVRLARLAVAGDAAARAEFADRMGCVPAMVASLNGRMGAPLSREEQLDVVQDVLIAVWSKLPGYSGDSTLESWVYPFCVLELLASLRRRRRRPPMLNVDLARNDTSLSTSGPTVEHADVHDTLGRISPEYAHIIRLKQFERLTFEEIGSHLEVSVNTVKTRYYRGLSALRKLMRAEREVAG